MLKVIPHNTPVFALRLCHSHSCFTLKLVFFPDISLTLSCLFPLKASLFQFFLKLINLIKKFNL